VFKKTRNEEKQERKREKERKEERKKGREGGRKEGRRKLSAERSNSPIKTYHKYQCKGWVQDCLASNQFSV
jgi:hypothetical protein